MGPVSLYDDGSPGGLALRMISKAAMTPTKTSMRPAMFARPTEEALCVSADVTAYRATDAITRKRTKARGIQTRIDQRREKGV